MKKQTALLCALALAAGGLAALTGKGKASEQAFAAESTSARSVVVYEQNFDNLSGQNIDELWAEDQLFWFVDYRADAAIKTVNGRKGLEITSFENGEFGGIGSGATSNLAKLVTGQRYRVSFYFEMNAAAENATFIMEPYDSDWTGVRITKTDMFVQNWQSTFNLQVHGNVFSFEFVPHKTSTELYIRLFTENFAQTETMFIDDFKIEAVDTIWGTNFRNEAIGADDGAHGDIEKLYGVEWGALTDIRRGEGYERFVRWSTSPWTPGNDNYVKMYLNNFGNLPIGNRNVRIQIDYELAEGSTDLVYCNASYYDPNGNVGCDIYFPYVREDSGIFNVLAFQDNGKIICEFTPERDFVPDAWGDFFVFTIKIGTGTLEMNIKSVEVSYTDGNVAKAGKILALADAIGTVVYTAECEGKVAAARDAYDAASDDVKKLAADALAKIEAAENTLNLMAAAAGVDTLIDNLPAANDVTLSDESDIEDAREAYEMLTDGEKAYVTLLEKLEACEDALAALQAAAALAEAQSQAKANIDTWLDANLDKYREAEQTVLTDLANAAKADIDNANTVQEVEDLADGFATAAAAVKTDEQLKAEEFAAKKQRAKDAINNYYETLLETSQYTEENAAKLLQAKNDCLAAIDAATTVDELNAAVTAGQNALDAVEKKATPSPQPDPQPQPEPEGESEPAPAKKKCGGSIVASSILVSTLALAGVGLLVSKKRKQD